MELTTHKGQIATAKTKGGTESFLWDGLALISRNETEYVNEPYVTGGNPILADGDLLFNDMLGSTIGIRSGKEYRETGMTAFGETDEKSAMFTGKPYIGELGYAFLFRNYRPEQGKWQTADPLGYPDGWNNFAYCNNWIISCVDIFGTDIYHVVASNAVDGLGHSAVIIGSGNTYYFYSFGSDETSGSTSSTPGCESGGPYSSYQDAFNHLQATRDKKAPYDQVQKWDTHPAEDLNARVRASEMEDSTYIFGFHDCLWFVYEVLEAGNVDFDRLAQTPVGAFERNRKYTQVIE